MRLRIGPLPAWVFPLAAVVVTGFAGQLGARAVLIALTALGLHALLAANAGQRQRLWLWIALCLVWGIAGGVLAVADAASRTACLTRYEGEQRVTGTELRPESLEYKKRNPALSNEELLFDAAGVPERVWTEASIARCRQRLQFLPLALPGVVLSFAIAALTALAIRRQALLPRAGRPAPESTAPGEALPVVYDCFISYRRQEPDRTFTLDLVNRLEEHGFKVAFDERDFRPNEHFLDEMERCIKQSRFTLCLVSRAYLASGNCAEEAVITKVLDMAERKRRLVPLFLEATEMPVWLYGLVGVNLYRADPAVDPFDKLLTLLRAA